MATWKGKTLLDEDGKEWPDIDDPTNWEAEEGVSYGSAALPGPPMTLEQLKEEIRKGDESGIAEGDVFARVRRALDASDRAERSRAA